MDTSDPFHHTQSSAADQSILSCPSVQVLNLNRRNVNEDVSNSFPLWMPGGLMYVLLAPTQTCTRLPDHDSLTCAKSERVDVCEQYIFMPNLVCCVRWLLEQWTDNRGCFEADRVVVIVFLMLHIFWLFLPQKKSLLEVGRYPWMLTTVPLRRRVCLSFLVGSQPVIWGGQGGWVMGGWGFRWF